jgi:putative endonuclease
MNSWHLYILELSDGSLYTGITVDLERRVRQHNEGKASRCTRSRRPVKLVFSMNFPDRSSASKEEIRIKKMTREQKLSLIYR